MILCCGEALIDMIPEPTVQGAQGFVPYPGGAVFNTAIALGRLGAKVNMFTGVSTDIFGALLEQSLRDSHVGCDTLVRSAMNTTLAMVHLTNGQASYRFYDENSAGQALRAGTLPVIPEGVEVLFFGGISLCNPPAADAYAALAAREAGQRLIMLDPNIRPGFASDEAAYRTRLEKMIDLSNIIKISDEDLDWIIPGDQPLIEKVKTLQTMGPALVLLTKGRDGSSAFLGDQQTDVLGKTVEVADTVGAGDTFNAGVLATLQEHEALSLAAIQSLSSETLAEVLQFANDAAAVTVSRAGANPPWRHEMDAPQG